MNCGFFSDRVIVFFGFAVLSSGCSNGHPTASGAPNAPGPTVDASAQLLKQVAGSRLYSQGGGLSLALAGDGTFELISNGAVEYHPELSAAGASPSPVSSSNCQIRVSGTAKYYAHRATPVPTHPREFTSTEPELDLTISGIGVLSSSGGTPSQPVSASEVCQGYTQALLKKRSISAPVQEFASDHIAFDSFSLNVPNAAEDKLANGGDLYGVSWSDGLGTAQPGHFYFVKQGAEVDVTSKVLSEISGSYSSAASPDPDTVKVEADLKELIIAQPACNASYEIDVSSITTDGNAFVLHGSIFQAVDLPATAEEGDASASSVCISSKKALSSLSANGLRLDYMTQANVLVLIIGDPTSQNALWTVSKQ